MTRLHSLLAQGWALVPLRLIVGFGFVAHGYAKLHRGPAHFATILDTMGIPYPTATAWLTTLIEILGGLAIAAGAAVSVVAIPLAIVMLTAMVTVHWPYGFSTIKLKALEPSGAVFGPPGYELNLVYIASLVALALSAPSPLSIDRWRRRS
jgi:putative oxidoreductase